MATINPKKKINAFLIWVGSEHYETIEDWTKEAFAMGVSKRIPSPSVGRALMLPNTVVFVAHDEGRFEDCSSCLAEIECPDCRKFQNAKDKLEEELEHYDEKTATEKVKTKIIAKIKEKIGKLDVEIENCEACLGSKRVESGTGGVVVFKQPKGVVEVWDYRKYNYWLHQPKIWTPAGHALSYSEEMCPHCGGTGRRPLGKVFGCFIPEKLEVIASTMEFAKGIDMIGYDVVSEATVAKEPKRGCGKRKVGGYYVRTSKGESADPLIASKFGSYAVKGGFVNFLSPFRVGFKRFRGIKKVDFDEIVTSYEDFEMSMDSVDAID